MVNANIAKVKSQKSKEWDVGWATSPIYSRLQVYEVHLRNPVSLRNRVSLHRTYLKITATVPHNSGNCFKVKSLLLFW